MYSKATLFLRPQQVLKYTSVFALVITRWFSSRRREFGFGRLHVVDEVALEPAFLSVCWFGLANRHSTIVSGLFIPAP
jgi:hypothetical protein